MAGKRTFRCFPKPKSQTRSLIELWNCSMDARDQLRRFLEQRREAGETELVFDHLSVDEAMRLLGAAPREEAGSRRQEAGKELLGAMPREEAGGRKQEAGKERNVGSDVPKGTAPPPSDWRAMLREAG